MPKSTRIPAVPSGWADTKLDTPSMEVYTGLSYETLRSWAKNGLYPEPEKGLFNFHRTVTGLLAYYQGKQGTGPEGGDDYEELRSEALREKILALQAERLERERKLVQLSWVISKIGTVLGRVQSRRLQSIQTDAKAFEGCSGVDAHREVLQKKIWDPISKDFADLAEVFTQEELSGREITEACLAASTRQGDDQPQSSLPTQPAHFTPTPKKPKPLKENYTAPAAYPKAGKVLPFGGKK